MSLRQERSKRDVSAFDGLIKEMDVKTDQSEDNLGTRRQLENRCEFTHKPLRIKVSITLSGHWSIWYGTTLWWATAQQAPNYGWFWLNILANYQICVLSILCFEIFTQTPAHIIDIPILCSLVLYYKPSTHACIGTIPRNRVSCSRSVVEGLSLRHETWSHLVLHIVKPRGFTWGRQEAL